MEKKSQSTINTSNKKNSDNENSLLPSKKMEINYENLQKSKNYVIKNNYWNDKHESILQNLQKNSNKLYREYQKAHIVYKKKLRLYRIPIIIMSGLSGFLSISNSGYIPTDYQQWISLFVGFVNLMVTIISLIENFKKIDVNVNKTYISYMEFKKLHDEISLILNTPQNERDGNGYDVSLIFFNRYEAYIADAPILQKVMHDYLDNNSPDNKSQTIIDSGSDDLTDNIIVMNDDDIESRYIPSKEKLKQILFNTKSDNSNKIKNIDVFKKIQENKISNKTINSDRIKKVNRFQEQFESMDQEVNKKIDENINKVNLENNLTINKENFPKLKNIKPNYDEEIIFNELTEIKFSNIDDNLINLIEDSGDDLVEEVIKNNDSDSSTEY